MIPDARVALVTGGAKRVGRATVLELARSGHDVAIHFRHARNEANSLAAEVIGLGRRAVAVTGDLLEPSSWPAIVEDTVAQLGRLDVLVNNASVFLMPQPDTAEDFDRVQWESILRVNVVAPMALSHAARPHLEAGGHGAIVNLCDISADRPWPDHLAYCASKAALTALTRGLARGLAPGIRVNGIAPGIAVFPEEYPDSLRKALTDRVPLRRAGSPEEIARVVRFLIEDAPYVTGQIITIDGGCSLV
jgi:pteridine reductase